ncbi:GntR family transcriptional regulator [Paenibacillus sp. UNCCL117]|uniref:GntR family transcriptional regulator n=1 Tax=unclassified Paenibacillus TaxID=185978 RepID=UPI000885C737|nr:MULTISPECIES: GntR family transcriptional regulator [unclassified Paenibacillus]SDE49039.1 transcriptional regulator, GntR family [Paenibacillus sp. cl123]SFW66795.1 GntR family transcriptional regulator [Paenibacillus sp. UNCCL117]
MKPSLNKNIPVPLYFQLKQYLIEQIDRGEMKPGDSIPSERELSEEFEISRMTVRQAVLELVNDGRLVREQGKGTFIAQPKISQGLFRLTSFSEDMISRGMKPGAYVVDVVVSEASATVQEALKLRTAAPVIILTRVRLADGKPMALEVTHLPLRRFEGLERENFEGVSLYRLLESKFGVKPASASQTIEVGMPNAREMNLLHVSGEVPMLLIKRVTCDEDGVPYEFVKSIYPGDRYKFHAELVR